MVFRDVLRKNKKVWKPKIKTTNVTDLKTTKTTYCPKNYLQIIVDIIVKDSVNSTCKLIDMTVPSHRNIALKEIEKKSKYKDLELEIQRMWHIKTIVKTSRKYPRELMWQRFKRSACWDLRESSEKVLVIWSERLTWVTDARSG